MHFIKKKSYLQKTKPSKEKRGFLINNLKLTKTKRKKSKMMTRFLERY